MYKGILHVQGDSSDDQSEAKVSLNVMNVQ